MSKNVVSELQSWSRRTHDL